MGAMISDSECWVARNLVAEANKVTGLRLKKDRIPVVNYRSKFVKRDQYSAWIRKGKIDVDMSDPNINFNVELPGYLGVHGAIGKSTYSNKHNARCALLLHLCLFGDPNSDFQWLRELMTGRVLVILLLQGSQNGRSYCVFLRHQGSFYLTNVHDVTFTKKKWLCHAEPARITGSLVTDLEYISH